MLIKILLLEINPAMERPVTERSTLAERNGRSTSISGLIPSWLLTLFANTLLCVPSFETYNSFAKLLSYWTRSRLFHLKWLEFIFSFSNWQCINFLLFKIYKGMLLKYWKYTFKFIILIWIFCFWWTILIRFISPKYTFNLKRKNIYIHFQLINLFGWDKVIGPNKKKVGIGLYLANPETLPPLPSSGSCIFILFYKMGLGY